MDGAEVAEEGAAALGQERLVREGREGHHTRERKVGEAGG